MNLRNGQGDDPPEPNAPASGEEAGAKSSGGIGPTNSAPDRGARKGGTDPLECPAVRDYHNRIGAETRGLRRAVVKENCAGYPRDIAVIRYSKEGDIECDKEEYAPTDLERQLIKAALTGVRWPEVKKLHRIINAPPMIRDADQEHVFEFRDTDGLIEMVQVRIEVNGERVYVPWTYWDDDVWRMCEPDGPLPLFNQDKIKDNATVFIHEGAKAARVTQQMIEGETREAKRKLADHPWGAELDGAVHVGFIGGAFGAHRTRWSVLKATGIKRAYIVADNDEPGRAVVPVIAQHLRVPTFSIQFTDEFPKSFDLADDFPESMFSEVDSQRFYVGPSMRECQHPATWATDVVPPKKAGGRPSYAIRDSFKSMWAYVEEADLYVCKEMPSIIRTEAVLNKMLADYSHAADTCRLILKNKDGRAVKACYRPDVDGLRVTAGGASAINLHVPGTIRAKAGDPKPFLEFMEYMFVDEVERHEALRWCATLIARPDLRMKYGMLLVSENQGVGKTTLGAAILAPLVGINNVSFPSESDVTSAFNEWIANKRLAIIAEIYAGHSWKAYHTLKAAITDTNISVNQKYVRQYLIENWCHVFASSNSLKALKLEDDDRRWLCPEVTEAPWPRARFDTLRQWLNGGGLSIIKHWAENFGHYVGPSERAPMTDRKRQMIEGSRSEAKEEAVAVAAALKALERPAALLLKDVVGWVRNQVQGKVFETDYELRKAMVGEGLKLWPERIKIGGRWQYVLVNVELWDAARRGDEPKAIVRSAMVKVSDILDGEM